MPGWHGERREEVLHQFVCCLNTLSQLSCHKCHQPQVFLLGLHYLRMLNFGASLRMSQRMPLTKACGMVPGTLSFTGFSGTMRDSRSCHKTLKWGIVTTHVVTPRSIPDQLRNIWTRSYRGRSTYAEAKSPSANPSDPVAAT